MKKHQIMNNLCVGKVIHRCVCSTQAPAPKCESAGQACGDLKGDHTGHTLLIPLPIEVMYQHTVDQDKDALISMCMCVCARVCTSLFDVNFNSTKKNTVHYVCFCNYCVRPVCYTWFYWRPSSLGTKTSVLFPLLVFVLVSFFVFFFLAFVTGCDVGKTGFGGC